MESLGLAGVLTKQDFVFHYFSDFMDSLGFGEVQKRQRKERRADAQKAQSPEENTPRHEDKECAEQTVRSKLPNQEYLFRRAILPQSLPKFELPAGGTPILAPDILRHKFKNRHTAP